MRKSQCGLGEIQEALQSGSDDLVIAMSAYYFYGDAAGGQDHGFIVVAGYLSTFERWSAFTGKWQQMLATFDVPYFHMKEFSQFKGPFSTDDWRDENKRARFLSSAALIIASHVLQGFSNLVDFKIFDEVNAIYRLDEVMGPPYALAGRTCIAKSTRFRGTDKVSADTSYIFEDGDKGKGELMRILERDGYPLPIFRPSRDKKTKDGKVVRGLLPLQAADFAAYELRKHHKTDPNELLPLSKYRKSLRALGRIPSDWGFYTKADLLKGMKKAERENFPIKRKSK